MTTRLKRDGNGCVEGVIVDYDNLKPPANDEDLGPLDDESETALLEHLYGAPADTIEDRILRSL